MSPHPARRLATWLCLMVAAGAAFGQATPAPDDPVLLENGPIKLHRSEYEAELLKLSPDVRPGFSNSQRRIADLLSRMLVQKTLAAQAAAEHLGERPQNAVRVRLEAERVLAQLQITEVEDRAAAAFDSRKDAFEARARELYAADRRKFEMPEQVSASHILFDLRKHSKDEGSRLAAATRARVTGGADFNAVAKEVSEDPSAGMNAGHLGWFGRGEMDAAFADAAFALQKPGDVSEPVLSKFGWHVIKLEDRRAARMRPYEEVRDLIMAELRRHYIDEQREQMLTAIRDDPGLKANTAAIDALYVSRPAGNVMQDGAGGAPGAAPAAPPGPAATTPRPLGTPPAGLRGAASGGR